MTAPFGRGSVSGLRGGAGVELAGEGAEFVGAIGDEAAEAGIVEMGLEGGDGCADVVDERIDADLKLDDVGGRTSGRAAGLIAEGLDSGANLVRVLRNEREFLAADFDGVRSDLFGDLFEVAGEMRAISERRK